MRNKRIAAYLCTGLLLLMAAGCGNSNAGSPQESNSSQPQANPTQLQPNSNTTQEDSAQLRSDNSTSPDDSAQLQSDSSTSSGDSAQLQPDNKTSQEDNAQLQSDTKLDGNIESIGDNNIVIDKTLYPSENVAVTSGDLITVYFTEETEFEVWTVKNSGVNGDSDIEKRQGAFSDLKVQASVELTGIYDGNDFYANHVIIYNFV